MSQGQRRLAAIMFTDMVGYTALSQSNESQAMEVLERHNRLLRPFFPKFHGKEIKAIGDSFLVKFDSALDAAKCASEIQQFLHDYNISSRDEWRITLRIGIHLGDVINTEDDVFGDAVNIASRIEPIAEPEGICISEQVYDQVRNKLEYRLVRLGPKELKNVAIPIDVYRLEMPWEQTPDRGVVLDGHRVAVMPLTNMISDPNEEYFADGMTEELISAVSKVPELSVISRTSVMQYKNQAKHATVIGRELNAGTLLEGSVRKAGNSVRIAVQLIDANNDRHLWAENYDRKLEDVFSIQSEIAEKVAYSLQVKLTEDDKERIGKGETSSVEAHTLYLKGKFNLERWDRTSLLTAIKHFEGALTHDGNYALAHCGLADAYSKLGFQEITNAKEAYQKSEQYARKALELDESLPEAHIALSHPLIYNYDFAGYERELKRAIELNPNLAEPHTGLATSYAFRNQWDECIAEVERALVLDPLSVGTAGSAGTWYLYSGRYDKAIEHLKDALELDPSNSFYLDNLGLAHIQKGMVEEGLAEVRRAVELSDTPTSYGDLAYAFMKAEKPEEARKLLTEIQESREGRPVPSTAIAGIYAALGDKEKAIEWLEKAYDEHSGYLNAINGDFVFENVRDEPRFQALLRKMGLK